MAFSQKLEKMLKKKEEKLVDFDLKLSIKHLGKYDRYCRENFKKIAKHEEYTIDTVNVTRE